MPACFVLPQQAAAQGTATASIANIGDVSEGAGNAQFTVSLDRAVNTDVILNLTYLATAAPNFGVTPADDLGSGRLTRVTIPANETQATFNVPIVDDDIVEFNETAIVSISANTPADLMIDSRNSRGSVTITDNDTAEFSLAVDRTSAAEGVDFTFTVSLSERVARRMLVGWTATGTGDNPATLGINGSDLEAPQIDRGDLTFDALTTTSQQFTVRILDDGNPEPDETFTVTLSNPRDSFFRSRTPPGLTVGSTDSQTVTIVNNDGEPDRGPAEVSLRVQPEYTLPGTEDGEGLFVLNVDKEGNVNGLLEEVTFTFSTANGTATAGTDYTAQTNQTRTILGSQTGLALPFVALGDNIVEEDETFTVTFSSSTDFVNGNDTITVTIVDQDAALVSLDGDASAREDADNITFTVKLLEGDDDSQGGLVSVAEDVAVTWTATAESSDTATVNTDLDEMTGTATIDAGDNEATFTVPITDDNIVEGDETFTVTLSALVVSGDIDADRVRLSPSAITATGTITDNDLAEVTLSTDTLTAAENGTFTYTVSLSAAADEAVTVRWTATDGTATVDDDLDEQTGTVEFSANTNTDQTFDIAVNDDDLDEDNEDFTVTLEVDTEGGNPLPTGVTIGTSNSATGTITDNDDTAVVNATVSIAAASADENVSGGNAEFTVSLSEAVNENVTLAVAYAVGVTNPATLDTDLGTRPDTVTIDQGQTSATLLVPIIDDSIVESDETFTVTISEGATSLPDGVTIGTGDTATGTITNDDTAVLGFTGSTFFVPTEGQTFTPTVSFLSSGATGAAVPVTLTWTAVSDDEGGRRDPGQPADLNPSSGTVTIPAGQSSADFTITVVDDTEDEPETEQLLIQLGLSTASPLPEDVSLVASSNAAYQRTVRVVDNDLPPPTTARIDDVSVDENVEGGNAQFTITLSTAQVDVTSFDLTYAAEGTNPATVADDLGDLPPNVSVSANTLTRTFNVPIVNDELVEGNETFTVTIEQRGGSLITLTKDTATGTIIDDDDTPAAVAPQITTQPTDQSVTVGGSATFTVTATGTPTPTYQWRFEGSDISGATSSTYTISSAALTNAGDYTVVVTNTAGAVTSTAATLTVTAAAVAPQITTQPTDQSVTVGGSATFTVTATGSPTPTYQWRFDGSDISGATSATYTISSAALTNAGDYTVVVTNTAGAVTSTAATLTVTPAAVAPQITTQPTDQSVTVGGSATFTVTATGTPTPTYQWRFDGSDISGATSSTYTISSAALTNAGDYTVVVTNTAGAVTSTAATLTVTAAAVAPQITTQPTDQSVTVGGSATFTVTATGSPTPTYQWRFDGSDISGATSATYTISSAALTNAGDYTVVVTNTAGTVTSTAATLTVTPAAVAPQITTQPTDQSVTVGGSATFTVTATGTPTPTYQWRFDGSDISGATSSTYTISSAALTNAGDYTVVVTNTAGTVTSSAATLTVTPAAVAPQITTQPTDQSVTVGGSATFTVTATGTPTPTYQWRFEGSDISGATSATYTISSAALTDAGDYTVVVTNTAGAVTSSAATLTVTAAAVAPQITTQPTDQSVTVGGSATFTVTATGTPTPTYQWRFEGSDISGATSSTYTISSAALTNAGDYTVVVTNTAGTVTSTAATLTVTPAAVAPQITTQPTDQSVTVGGSATFTVAATGTPTPTYQWRFEGSDISGATSASYTLSNAALTNAGDYTVVVTNTAGTVTSSAATLTVAAAPPATAPDLTVGSVSVSSASVVEGASFTINATVNNEGDAASAATTLTYYRSTDATITTGDTSIGTDAVGALAANGSSTQDASVSIATAGTYHVGACVPTVSGETDTDNNCSTGVQVTVTAAAVAPQITTQPTDQSVTVGENATFTVAATGTPTPTYQWRFEGSDISGATSETYTLSSAALTNAGDYTVVVTNTAGTVTSTAATLTVTAAPPATAPDLTVGSVSVSSASVVEGASFTINATVNNGGNAASAATTLTYYRSADATITTGDTSIGTDAVGALAASGSSPENISVSIATAGTYYVGACVPTVSGETDTDNNCSTGVQVTVTAAAVDAVINLSAVADVSEAANRLNFRVDLDPQIDEDVTVAWAVTGGTATAADFDQYASSGTVVISADQGNARIRFRPVDDDLVEGSETLELTISADDDTPLPDGVTIGTATATGTLTDNDEAVAPQITTQPVNRSVTVGDDATFTVAATGAPTPTYQWRKDGTAISGATSASYTISNASSTDAGSYTVVVTNTAGAVTSTAATLTVTPAAEVSIGNASMAENGVNAEFTVSLTRAVTEDVTVAVAYTAGTATLDTDLGTLLETVTIDQGETSATLLVPIFNDSIVEGDEDFTVTISEGATPLPDDVIIAAAATGTGTITEDDAGEVTLTANTATANENGGTFSYTVNLSAAADEAVVVRWTATDGTATVDDDLQAPRTGTVTFPANASTAQTFTISPANDNEDEDNETFTVTLGADGDNPLPTGVTIGADNSSEATIIDDDDTAELSIAATATAAEGSAVAFAVNLSAAWSSPVTVRWTATATGEGAATLSGPNSDLAAGHALTGTVEFAADDTAAKTVSFATVNDDRVEGVETFTVTLSEDIIGGNPLPDGVSIPEATAAGAGTITEAGAAVLSIGDASAAEGSAVAFAVNLSASSSLPVTVRWTATTTGGDGAATLSGPNSDLTADHALTGTVVFEPDDTAAKTVSFATADDDRVEGAETFTVTLSADTLNNIPLPAGVSISPTAGAGTGTITEDEPSVLIEPRRIGAGTALRRHAGRFDSLTGTVARNRLEARETRSLSGSKDLGSGAVAVGGSFDQSRWGAWIDGAWAGFGGNASGRQADVYGGVDYLAPGNGWLIGALIGYEAADLKIGEASYRADYTHFGLYGGARLSETLLFDGAATYGAATPDIALGDVSASYDAYRITARGALTGDFGLEYGLLIGSLKIEPQLGLLYSRETLGAFTDSAGGVAGREILQLGRFSAGPRLTWGFDGGRVEGGARVQWDFLQLDDGVDGRISGAADIGVTLDLTPRVTLGVQGDVDGIGVSDEFGSVGGKIELKARF